MNLTDDIINKMAFSAVKAENAIFKLTKRFSGSNFPETLSDELSIISPYTSREIQKVVDFVTAFYGLDEKAEIVRAKCENIIRYAMENLTTLHDAQYLVCHNNQ